MARYSYQPFEYVTPPGISGKEDRHQVVIIGAGPIGLSLAIDLAQHDIPCILLDDNNVVSIGSRAICWAKRTLEIFDRLGVGERMLEKGVTWKVGRLFHGEREVYNFDLLPEAGHKYPAFINLQQYYVEQYLVERAKEFPEKIDLRFNNEVINHQDMGDHVLVDIKTPDGTYSLESEYLLACDGAGSPTRRRMGLAFDGQRFEEHFLIVDVEMKGSPFDSEGAERWFWFEPAFHPGQSALLHKQPDNIYRIDLQLGPETDPKAEACEDRVLPRIKAIIGDKRFKLDWMSVYQFRCAGIDQFVHNRVIFAGDSAHVVSPFGARGGNSGIQDIDNLGWKLAAILRQEAPQTLLDTYHEERKHGAEENILHSSRATNFMTPKSPIEHQFRAEILKLSRTMPFARRLINSGRLSQPCLLSGMGLQGESAGALISGSPLVDAPLADGGWLIEKLQGEFTLVGFGNVRLPKIANLPRFGIGEQTGLDYPCALPAGSFAYERYGRERIYLLRPDGHVAASFAAPDPGPILRAYQRACGKYQ